MTTSADSISFFLELEDKLSPALALAGKNYESFTKRLDTINKKANKSVNSSFAAMTELAKSFAKLPEQALKSYNSAYNAMKRSVKPLKQTIDVVIGGAKGSKVISDAIAKGVAKALAKATIRLSPVLPSRRAKGFDNSHALKSAYLHETQPPDAMGSFKIPRFSKGGDVRGGSRKGFDDVLALLSKNEMVLPSTEADMLRKLAKKKTMSRGMSQGMSDVHNFSILMDNLTSKSALSSAERKILQQSVSMSSRAKGNLGAAFSNLPLGQQASLNPRLNSTNKMLSESVKSAKALLWNTSRIGKIANGMASGFAKVQKTLKGIQTDTKFIAFAKLWETWRKNVKDGAKNLQSALGTDSPVQNFFDNMNQSNRTLHMSRMELYGMRTAMIDMAKNGPGVLNPTVMGETVNEMIDAGMRMQTISKFAGLTAISTQAMRINLGTAASLTRIMADNMHLDQKGAANMFRGLSKTAEQGPNSAETLAERMMQNRRNMGAAFENIGSAEQKKAVLTNLSAMSQALEKFGADTDNHIGTMISKATNDMSSPEGQAVMALTGLQGDQITNQLKTAKGTEYIIQRIGESLKKYGRNPTILKSVNTMMHLGFENEGDMLRYIDNLPNIKNGFEGIATAVQDVADPWEQLNNDAKKGKSWTERMQNFVVNWSYSKAQGIIDFLHEFNFMQAASAIYLAKNIAGMFTFTKNLKEATVVFNLASAAGGWAGFAGVIKNLPFIIGAALGPLGMLLVAIAAVTTAWEASKPLQEDFGKEIDANGGSLWGAIKGDVKRQIQGAKDLAFANTGAISVDDINRAKEERGRGKSLSGDGSSSAIDAMHNEHMEKLDTTNNLLKQVIRVNTAGTSKRITDPAAVAQLLASGG